MIPPCNHICPAGNNVQGFLNALAHDEVDAALEIILRTSPFPSVCGRACPAPCMQNCNRIELDGAVNVRQLERYAGDKGTVSIEPETTRDEKVAISRFRACRTHGGLAPRTLRLPREDL